MAGTTTNFAIPYPSVTDYVTDGATAMRTLAEQVDAVMTSGTPAKNLLINGAMQVNQRSAVATAVPGIASTGYYTADRWALTTATLGTAVFRQTTVVDAPSGSGFINSLKLECTTANASPAVGFQLIMSQSIEGQNLQSLRKGTASAQTMNLSFWVKAFQTGVYVVEISDAVNSASYSKSYTIAVAGTWQFVSFAIPADTVGTLTNSSVAGIVVNFWLGAGSTFSSGAMGTVWASTVSANRAVGQTNLASSTSNYWQVTGTQLTVGSVAVPFEFKSFADELRDCQRYYYRVQTENSGFRQDISGYGSMTSASAGDGVFIMPVTMRTKPSALEYSGLTWNDYNTYETTGGTWTMNTALSTKTSASIAVTGASGGGARAFNQLSLTASASSYIAVTAEL